MNAVDTNILIYARDPRDEQKQATAEGLLSSMIDGVLLEAGVTRPYSEDFDASAQAEGIEIVNPFSEAKPTT